MNRDYEKFLQDLERMVHQYNQMEKKKRTYGLSIPLSCTEIHILDEIGNQEGIGVKAIAQSKGVTEGAVSQLIKKLIEKDLVKKESSKESDAKVCLFLTENGKICYEAHKDYHKQANLKWYALLDELTESEYKHLQILLEKALTISITN